MFFALRTLVDELLRLFNERDSRLWFGLTAALLCQLAYWYLGEPPRQPASFPQALPALLIGLSWTLIFLLVIPLFIARFSHLTAEDLGFRRGDATFGLRATLFVSVIAVLIIALSAPAQPLQLTGVDGAGRDLLGWTTLVALHAVALETFYRGFMLRTLEPFWGLRPAMWTQLLCYVLIHLGKPLAEVLIALPLGLMLTILAVRGRSLLWPILLATIVGVSRGLLQGAPG